MKRYANMKQEQDAINHMNIQNLKKNKQSCDIKNRNIVEIKNAIVIYLNNLRYIHHRVKQQYKVEIYPRLWNKNIKITNKIRKFDQPMKADIQIITIPDKKEGK